MEIAVRLVAFMAFSIVLNIPFGSYRNLTRKFSILWWLSIHVPIPFIILMRTRVFDLAYTEIIPFSIAAAIIGQIIGKKMALFGHRREAEPVPDTVNAVAQTEVGAEVEGS